MMYGSWDKESNRYNFLSLWVTFCHLTALTICKTRILKKWKKTPRDITILQMYTINDNHIMYGSRDMEYNRQNFSPTPLTIQFDFEKMQKTLEISSFYISIPKNMIISYSVPEIRHMTDVIFFIIIFHLGAIFWKNEKKHLKITSFYTCAPKIIITWCTVFEIWYARNGQRRMEKKTWRGGCPI